MCCKHPQAMFFPAEEREPRFIGATQGHGPILMHCGACEYTGWSAVR
jgi:protein tyrosine/serine phosphatase